MPFEPFEKWVNIDLTAGPRTIPVENGFFTQDNQANLLGIRVLKNGVPRALSGTVGAYVKFPDGTTLAAIQGTIGGDDNNEASVLLPAEAYSQVGSIEVTIYNRDGGPQKVLAVFYGYVHRTRTDSEVTPPLPVPDISQIISQYEQMVEATDEVREILTDETKEAIIAVTDGVILWSSHSGSRSAFIPVDIKNGDHVYIEINAKYANGVTPSSCAAYLSDGTSPYPQHVSLEQPSDKASIDAQRNYNTVVLWFNTTPAVATAKIYTSPSQRVSDRFVSMKRDTSVTYNYTGAAQTVTIPFAVHKGDAIWFNVSNVVAATMSGLQIGFRTTISATPSQMTETVGIGPSMLVAEDDYGYVVVWLNATSITGARISVCLGESRSQYKTYSILGDSYSSYEGYIPSGNAKAYPISGNDVNDVSQMWFRQFGDRIGATLDVAEAWSGSPVCNWCWNHDTSANSFVTRVTRLPENSDIIFVFGGTNDHNGTATIGEYKYDNWAEADLKTFRPAYAYVLNWILVHRPNSRLIAIINSGLDSGYSTSMKTIANHYGIPTVELANIAKIAGHPNKAGMVEIGAQVNDALLIKVTDDQEFPRSIAVAEQLATLSSRTDIGTMAEFKTYLGIA